MHGILYSLKIKIKTVQTIYKTVNSILSFFMFNKVIKVSLNINLLKLTLLFY